VHFYWDVPFMYMIDIIFETKKKTPLLLNNEPDKSYQIIYSGFYTYITHSSSFFHQIQYIRNTTWGQTNSCQIKARRPPTRVTSQWRTVMAVTGGAPETTTKIYHNIHRCTCPAWKTPSTSAQYTTEPNRA